MNLPQPDEKRWERQAVDGRGQAQALPMKSPLELLLALDGALQVTGGLRRLKKSKDFIFNNYYHKVIERYFFLLSFLMPRSRQSLNMFRK